MRVKGLIAIAALMVAPLPGFTQEVEVSQTRKTIDVTVTDTTEANPEIAVIHVGYRNYAATRDAALSESARATERITSGFAEAGIPNDAVETETVYVGEPEASYEGRAPQGRQFESHQVWAIRVAAPRAQAVLDRILEAGANELEAVEWQVTDPSALEAQADSAALAKARARVARLAEESHKKLGELLYIGNTSGVQRAKFAYVMTEAVALKRVELHSFKLFPARVRQEATVHVIFALE